MSEPFEEVLAEMQSASVVRGTSMPPAAWTLFRWAGRSIHVVRIQFSLRLCRELCRNLSVAGMLQAKQYLTCTATSANARTEHKLSQNYSRSTNVE